MSKTIFIPGLVTVSTDLGAIVRVVAYGPNQVAFGVTPDSFGDPFNGRGVLWTGTNPGASAVIPPGVGTLSYFVGAPDRAEGYAAESDGGAGFDSTLFHHYTGGWTLPAGDVAPWADVSDPVVWRGADATHADAAVLGVGHFGTAHAVVWELTYSGGTPSLSSFDAGMPGGFVERGFDFRARLAGSPGHWWATGRSRYGDGSNDNMWAARLTSGGAVDAYGVPVAQQSAGVCLWVGSDSDVWVGGFTDLGVGVDSAGQRPWLWHFDGGWSEVPVPDLPPDSPGAIQGVHGVSGSDLWAVGHVDDQTGGSGAILQRILIYHNTGSGWALVPGLDLLVPPAVHVQQVLYDVYAYAADDVWAVGTAGYQTSVSDGRLLALHYDGVSWAVVPITYTGV